MSDRRILVVFRVTVLACFALLLLAPAIQGPLDASLPDYLSSYLYQVKNGFWSGNEAIFSSIDLAVYGVALVGLLGMSLFRAWGVWMLLGSEAVSITMSLLFVAPVVDHAWTVAAFDAALVLKGFSLGLLLSEPVSQQFWKRGTECGR